MKLQLPRLGPDPDAPFPPPHEALADPPGLLAWGGDLHPERLLRAYREGIFPWYTAGEPILWWSPDPRTVLDTRDFSLPRRLRRDLRRSDWTVRADTCFDEVVSACATAPRRGQHGTWITPAMHRAYVGLHRLGHAHSVEVFDGERLVGGIYGIDAGGVFCGESMFSAVGGASKVALAALCSQLWSWGADLLDAQVSSPHLASLGARPMSRAEYLQRLQRPRPPGLPRGSWLAAFSPRRACELA